MPDDDDDLLDIELEDLGAEEPAAPLSPAPDPGPTLEITLDDLGEEPDASEYPALTAQQVAAANSVTIRCVCSAAKQAFTVRYEEDAPGDFWSREVSKDPGGVAGGGAGGAGSPAEIRGAFHMGPEYACPYCGACGLSRCEVCGVVLCEGGTGKDGTCLCPGCNASLTLGSSMAASVAGSGYGKGKGK